VSGEQRRTSLRRHRPRPLLVCGLCARTARVGALPPADLAAARRLETGETQTALARCASCRATVYNPPMTALLLALLAAAADEPAPLSLKVGEKLSICKTGTLECPAV